MIISNSQIEKLLALYLKQDNKFSPTQKEERVKAWQEEAYKIAVSRDAEAYSAAKQAIRELPDVREEILAKIQKQVKSGTYEVNDEKVAEKMIGRSLVDKLV